MDVQNKFFKIIYTYFVLLGLLISETARAVNITNPAPNFFVDLTQKGFDNTFLGALQFFIDIALGLAGTLAIFFIIVGGYQYLFSGANEELAATGKKTLKNAIIGITVILLSYVIIRVISATLR